MKFSFDVGKSKFRDDWKQERRHGLRFDLMLALPGITEMVFRARSTLKVLNAETFPRSINSVTYLEFDIRRFINWDQYLMFRHT